MMSRSNQHDRMICTCVGPPSGFPLLCILRIRYGRAKYSQWLVLNGCKHPDSGVDYVYSLQLAREMVSSYLSLLLKGYWYNAIASECLPITVIRINFRSFFQDSLTQSLTHHQFLSRCHKSLHSSLRRQDNEFWLSILGLTMPYCAAIALLESLFGYTAQSYLTLIGKMR